MKGLAPSRSSRTEELTKAIHAHEFISLDGVIESPSWTAPYGFAAAQAAAIGRLTAASRAILLGRKTYEMFAPAWSARTRPG